MNHRRISAFSLGAVACLLLVACATTPTGRGQLKLVSDQQMNQMGVQAFDEMKEKIPQETDPAVVGYVRCVVLPIIKQAEDPTGVRDWEIVVFKDPTANAFALPGGKIGVHTGLLTVAETPGQLAAVMGHEVAHVIARHGNERVSEASLANLGMQVLSETMRNSEHHDLLMGALGLGAQFGVMMPHSRKHESEADIIGLDLMARAGFDPQQSTVLWRNMAQASGGQQPPEFLSTHPSHETRINGLEEKMPQAMKAYQQAQQRGALPNCQQP